MKHPNSLISPHIFQRYNKRKNIDEQLELYQIKELMNEAYHVYEPKLTSQYRKNIDIIVKDIQKNIRNIDSIQILVNGLKAKIFEYDYIFADFSFIDTLRIYIVINNSVQCLNTNGIAITDNDVVKNDFVNSELPVCIFNNNHFELCSIILPIDEHIIKNENLFYSQLKTSLSHELKHILDNCWNRKNLNKTLNQNDIKNFLLQKYNVDIDSLTKLYNNWSLKEFVFFISQCLYYCQYTEMSAHIETIIKEAEISIYRNNNQLRRNLYNKNIIRNFLSLYSETFQVYEYYQHILQSLINIPENELFINPLYKKEDILNILNQFTDKKYNLHHYIRYWYKQINIVIDNVISLFPKYIKDNF